MEEEEIFSRREENEGISLTGGPGDPASPASLVHKADRCEGRGERGEGGSGRVRAGLCSSIIDQMSVVLWSERSSVNGGMT